GWLLANAALPLAYRAATDVARLPAPLIQGTSWMPYVHPLAQRLAGTQRNDGSWNGAMLSAPQGAGLEAVGLIPALRRVLEYGWDRESPALLRSRRLLFRLLAEDNDPAYLCEFAAETGTAEDLIHRARVILREAAAATLAQAGYERDPR